MLTIAAMRKSKKDKLQQEVEKLKLQLSLAKLTNEHLKKQTSLQQHKRPKISTVPSPESDSKSHPESQVSDSRSDPSASNNVSESESGEVKSMLDSPSRSVSSSIPIESPLLSPQQTTTQTTATNNTKEKNEKMIQELKATSRHFDSIVTSHRFTFLNSTASYNAWCLAFKSEMEKLDLLDVLANDSVSEKIKIEYSVSTP